MAKKLPHGLDIYTMLVDIIMQLTPLQAESLYSDLLARYNKTGRVTMYNSEGEEDRENGLIRLMPFQYRTLRTKFGDSYIKKSFKELENYIKFLKEHSDDHYNYKQKLRIYSTGTHNKVLKEGGWVYEKCKQYICTERINRIKVNPFLIDDFEVAKEYIKCIPKDMRESAMDVQALLLKFPELIYVEYESE